MWVKQALKDLPPRKDAVNVSLEVREGWHLQGPWVRLLSATHQAHQRRTHPISILGLEGATSEPDTPESRERPSQFQEEPGLGPARRSKEHRGMILQATNEGDEMVHDSHCSTCEM